MKTPEKRTYPAQVFQFNEYAIDWPLNGHEETLAEDVKKATLNSFNAGADVSALSIGRDLPPRVLGLLDAFPWFEREGYFFLDRERHIVTLTEKWKGLFLETKQN